MAFSISALINKFKREVNYFTSTFYGGVTIDSSPYDRQAIVEAYETGIEARTVIDKVANGFASLPIKLVDKDNEEVTDHWSLDLLTNPNPLQTQKQFEFDYMLQFNLMEENFINGGVMGIGMSEGKPQFLKMLPGQYVDFKVDKFGNITEYVNSFNSSIALPLDAVKPTIGSVLDPVRSNHATPKLYTATLVAETLKAGHINQQDSITNKGIGVLVSAKVDGKSFSETQHKNLLERFNNPAKAGQIEATSAAVDVNSITKSPVELGILETTKEGRIALALVFNVPIPLIDGSAMTDNNMAASERSFIENNLIPKKQLYCEKITEFFKLKKDGLKYVVDVEAIKQLRPDPKVRQEELDMARASINERRLSAGLPELKGEENNLPVLRINDQIGIAPDIDLTPPPE